MERLASRRWSKRKLVLVVRKNVRNLNHPLDLTNCTEYRRNHVIIAASKRCGYYSSRVVVLVVLYGLGMAGGWDSSQGRRPSLSPAPRLTIVCEKSRDSISAENAQSVHQRALSWVESGVCRTTESWLVKQEEQIRQTFPGHAQG